MRDIPPLIVRVWQHSTLGFGWGGVGGGTGQIFYFPLTFYLLFAVCTELRVATHAALLAVLLCAVLLKTFLRALTGRNVLQY